MNFSIKQLPNKIRVLTSEMPELTSATVTVWVGVGSRFEEDRIAGISHFIEHMSFKGGRKYKTAQAVSETIDGMGADYNAATSSEWTNFFVRSRSENLEKAFDVLSDMILYPTLDQSEIEKERSVILEEISMQEDSPIEKIGELFNSLVFENTPLGRDIAGSKDTVRSIAREDFIKFRHTHYKGGNIVITVSGGVSEKEVLSLAQKYFSEVEPGEKEVPLPFESKSHGPLVHVFNKKSEQAHFILGFLGSSRKSPDRYPENVLATILGRGMSSRLFNEIREKRGLAYTVSTSVSRYIDTGVFETYAGVDPKRINEALSVMLEQHYGIPNLQFPISDREVNKAKEYIKGRISLALEDTISVNDYFGQRALFMDMIETPDQIFEKIDAVTLEDIYSVATKLFSKDRLRLAIIGPFKSKDQFDRIIAGS